MLFCVYVRNLSPKIPAGTAPFEYWVVSPTFDQAVDEVHKQIKDQPDLIIAGARLKAPVEGISSFKTIGDSSAPV